MITLISLIIIIVVIGVLMWLINAYAPMAAPFKQILNGVVVVALVLWLLLLLLGMATVPVIPILRQVR